MPYSSESSSDPDDPGRREQEKAWKQRNSDGRNTFEGERTQGPPAFDLDEYPLPMSEEQRPTDREEPEGVTERHTHVYDVTEPDWEVQP